MKNPDEDLSCAQGRCRCQREDHGRAGWDRREFLRILGVGTSAVVLQPWRAMAGPFTQKDFEKLVPSDKKLRPEWVASLTARGEPTVYRGTDLDKIGMPIGGLCAGQLYLGGDGKLWHWDIFNQQLHTGAEHYAKPMSVVSPVDQGFALRLGYGGKTEHRLLDKAHWRDVSFNGEYPIGRVDYQDPNCPVTVRLEAFSPFIPLSVDDSSLPATVLEFTLTNRGEQPIKAELGGWLQNAVCLHSGQLRAGNRRNRLSRKPGLWLLECTAQDLPAEARSKRPDIVFEDFEKPTYGAWQATGTAFGTGPVEIGKIPDYQGQVGGAGKSTVNSHATAPGSSVSEKDGATGRLISPDFTIERDYITFLIGGGNHQGRTCMNLVVDGQVVLSATGAANNRMQPQSWSVRSWAGKKARLEIVDEERGGWGNVGVDDILFSDQPRAPLGPLAEAADFGSLGLGLLDPGAGDWGVTALAGDNPGSDLFANASVAAEPVTRPFDQKLCGGLVRQLTLEPGRSAKVVFVLTWFMPNLKMDRLPPGRFYAARFSSATGVAEHVALNIERLTRQTRLWHQTWYDSSLPYWFLDRTFLNTSILATSTCYRFGDGRFYGWEGVGCCAGTCGHVWQYAHAVARLFPELERITRERVDFGLALQPDGAIYFRGEFNNIPAVDGQAGTILRALREHQMTTDLSWLKRNWPNIRRATEWLIAKDGDGDGLITGNQHNTLDTDWFGPVAWLSGLYLAALLAAAHMADETGDAAFAEKCRKIVVQGKLRLVADLFEDAYFINKPDPNHLDAINSGTGCHIDQVMGQSWAHQVGLPRILPEPETRSALQSLWRYNFTPDVGPYREAYRPGRWYAMAGEAGLLMCSFPRLDWDYAQAKGKGPDWAAGYLNECMNGFEYQVAGHMLWEGLLTEGLAVTRAVHDRYHPSRRNPWNEVECGDHYARSMASYGVFLAACGFEYDGPRRHIGFAPKLNAEKFRCAFTSAEGWGSFSQEQSSGRFRGEVQVRWGKLEVKSLALRVEAATRVRVSVEAKDVPASHTLEGTRLLVTLDPGVELRAGQSLTVSVT